MTKNIYILFLFLFVSTGVKQNATQCGVLHVLLMFSPGCSHLQKISVAPEKIITDLKSGNYPQGDSDDLVDIWSSCMWKEADSATCVKTSLDIAV